MKPIYEPKGAAAVGAGADSSRTCQGCEHVKSEPWAKRKTGYRCFAPGPYQGYHVGTGRFLPYIPAWCPLMQGKEGDDGTGKQG